MAKKTKNLNIPANVFGVSGTSSNISITSGSGLVYNGSQWVSINQSKTTYHILGEEVEVDGGYRDVTLVTNIATLNVLGKPFLDELHKNGTFFPDEIEKYLEKKFKWLERDKKIDDIIN